MNRRNLGIGAVALAIVLFLIWLAQPADTGNLEIEPVPAAPSPAPVAVDPDAPRVDRAQVALRDASSLSITCGDRSASGTASVRITDFPAGPCTVRAVYLGTTYTTSVTLERVRGSTCTIANETLTCP